MKADELRIMGTLNLLFQFVAMLFVLSPVELRPQTSHRISVCCFSFIGIGIGLLLLRKWAVLYFCLASICAAAWLFSQSISLTTFRFNPGYLSLAVVFLLPTVVYRRSWSILTWGGKWFF